MDHPKSGAMQRREAHTASGGGRDKPDKPKKDKKDKGKHSGSKRNKKNKKDTTQPKSRVVIRRLPPSMTEELFCEQISVDGQLPNYDDFYFVGPDWTLGHHASCRAYLNFTNPEDIFRFADSFDGYTFVDAKGLEYQAVVEYAPFQKLPKNRSRKKDLKCNSIETDTHFTAFKEALEAEEREALHGRGTQEFSFKLEQEEKTTTTPLLEYIAQRKQEKRDEKRRKQEEKRRIREEERHMRKTQIAKAIPAAIQEDIEFNEFMERTVKPHLNLIQNSMKGTGFADGADRKGSNEGKFRDEKDKNKKNKKDKDRNREKKVDESKVQEDGKAEGDKQANKKQDREKPGKKSKEKPNRDENRPQQRPQEQWEQKGERNEKPKKEKPPAAGNSDQATTSKADYGTSTAPTSKKEVKKYSERRKETRARAETRLAEHDTKPQPESTTVAGAVNSAKPEVKKIILTANVPPFIPKEKSTILLAGHSSTVTNNPAVPSGSGGSVDRDLTSSKVTKKASESPSPEGSTEAGASRTPKAANEKTAGKQKETREARKIRNKDRPSLEIYQPRKRIVSGGTGKSEDDRGRSDSDRPSDNVSAATTAVAAESEDGAAKERRHKLTKKASDRQQRERKNGRKNSSDADGTKETDAGWWM
ncbi:regulator of nonsense transcripts 3A [Anopheles nili]|uniref:regulator of nonsense transcripts 3A n=1 Tax=Anopheles nili TaxID=185578 RepID=UPI00237B1B87|nr:regulator of nonsense transcripts 3A [Anopheles nili]